MVFEFDMMAVRILVLSPSGERYHECGRGPAADVATATLGDRTAGEGDRGNEHLVYPGEKGAITSLQISSHNAFERTDRRKINFTQGPVRRSIVQRSAT
jgi:hypothetical protein